MNGELKSKMMTSGMRHGGAALIEGLARQGVERVFCVPGESYLAALDGLHGSGIDVVVTRHEGGAAMMAEADGKLTGRPGIAFVTRGPGATNAASGVHVAFQDSTPMILFVGQVASDQKDREAFQEVDYRAMFGPLAKWVAEVDRTDRIPEYVSRAFRTAMSGRPGPIVLALPEDVLAAPCEAPALPRADAAVQSVGQVELERVAGTLRDAARPFLLVGGGGWDAEARDALGHVAEVGQVPVGTSFRCQDYIDPRNPAYAGDVGIAINPALAARIDAADQLVVLGARLGEMTTGGYARITPPDPKQALTHIHPDPNELGRVYRPTDAISANSSLFIKSLANVIQAPNQDRSQTITEAHDAFLAWRQPQETPGAVKMEAIIAHLNEVLPESAIVTNGATAQERTKRRLR